MNSGKSRTRVVCALAYPTLLGCKCYALYLPVRSVHRTLATTTVTEYRGGLASGPLRLPRFSARRTTLMTPSAHTQRSLRLGTLGLQCSCIFTRSPDVEYDLEFETSPHG
jgi:hypothetical protein